MTKRIISCGMFLGLVTVLSLPLAQVSAGNWNTGNKTERSMVAPGVYVERKVNKKTGEIVSEVTLMQTPSKMKRLQKLMTKQLSKW